MLGTDMNTLKSSGMSKSSIINDQKDPKKLRQMIQQRDEIISTLKKKILKLQKKLSGKPTTKTNIIETGHDQSQSNNYLQLMLKQQMDKANLLQQMIEQLTGRINTILIDVSKDDSFSDSTIDLQLMMEKIPIQEHYVLNNSSFSSKSQDHEEINITYQCYRKIDILEGLITNFKTNNKSIKQDKKSLLQKLQSQKQHIIQLQFKLTQNQQIKHLRLQLKQQRKQRQRLKGLLERSELQKNQLTNKINNLGLKDEKIKLKTKEQLLQYSKELNYKVKDLEKEKDDLMKETTKDKELELKKYMNVLNKLKIIKENSRIGGHSFA